MRSALVSALVACAESPGRAQARRFLCGLSSDELQFIADYVGASIIEREHGEATRLEDFERAVKGCAHCSDDLDLKMILVLEYLGRCGPRQRAVS